jgi:hypothetical protein
MIFEQGHPNTMLSDWQLQEQSDRRIRNDWFRTWMPYCFQPMKVPGARKHVYIPLNRFYKPLGISRRAGHIVYEEHSEHFVRFTSDPAKLRGVWNEGSNGFYLYNDKPSSTNNYGERLHELMRHVNNDWERASHRVVVPPYYWPPGAPVRTR